MYLTPIEYVIMTIPAILQVLIAVVIFRRSLFRLFPIFTTYTIYQLVTLAVLTSELVLHFSSLHYAYTFYPFQVCSIGLGFGVIFEVFKIVLEPYDALTRVWRFLFLTASLVLFAIAVVWVLYGAGPEADRLTQSMNLLERSLRLVQVGLLVMLFLLSSSLGLTWRSYSFGLALGYGTFAIIDLTLWAIRLEYGNAFWKPQNMLGSLAYNVMIIIWTWYLLQPERLAHPVRVIPHNDIEKWNEKLEELLRPKRVHKNDVAEEKEENDDLPVSRR